MFAIIIIHVLWIELEQEEYTGNIDMMLREKNFYVFPLVQRHATIAWCTVLREGTYAIPIPGLLILV